MRRTLIQAGVVIAAAFLLNGCLSKTKNPSSPQDPYEKMNRSSFKLNKALDNMLYRPVAAAYKNVVPSVMRTGLHNALDNFATPTTIVNDMLQGNFSAAASDSWRMTINSTVGIVGIVDVATHMGLPNHHEDFGLTLAKWGGGKPSMYYMLPLFGPSTARVSFTTPVDLFAFSLWPYIRPGELEFTLYVMNLTDQRSQLLDADPLIQTAFDPYIFVRNAYLQKRNALVEFNQTAKGPVSPPQFSDMNEEDMQDLPTE